MLLCTEKQKMDRYVCFYQDNCLERNLRIVNGFTKNMGMKTSAKHKNRNNFGKMVSLSEIWIKMRTRREFLIGTISFQSKIIWYWGRSANDSWLETTNWESFTWVSMVIFFVHESNIHHKIVPWRWVSSLFFSLMSEEADGGSEGSQKNDSVQPPCPSVAESQCE